MLLENEEVVFVPHLAVQVKLLLLEGELSSGIPGGEEEGEAGYLA